MLVDTHAHIYLNQFAEDRDEVISRALDYDVQRIYLPNVDRKTIEPMLALEAAYPKHCFAMMGLHPCSVKENYEEELALVKEWLWKRDFCAVGEIGTDLYWDKSFYKQQVDAFQRQMEWAKELDIPIVIHCRDSLEVTIDLVREAKTEKLRGIFHCFGGTVEQAQAIVALGFHIGIGGVATFKKSGLDKVLPQIPLSAVVLETDAPYLTPVPFRGKRNESAYIHHIAMHLASVYSVSMKTIAKMTSQNAQEIFGKGVYKK